MVPCTHMRAVENFNQHPNSHRSTRNTMDRTQLKPIDLDTNFDVCVRFRTDSYYCSFGNLDGLPAEMGPGGAAYRERMIEKCRRLPSGNVHLFANHEIVGQLEMRYLAEENVAYVNLFYVVPHARRTGLGRILHQRALEVANYCRASKLRLSVSKTNLRAIAFYRSLGWLESGSRSEKHEMWVMERHIEPAIG